MYEEQANRKLFYLKYPSDLLHILEGGGSNKTNKKKRMVTTEAADWDSQTFSHCMGPKTLAPTIPIMQLISVFS